MRQAAAQYRSGVQQQAGPMVRIRRPPPASRANCVFGLTRSKGRGSQHRKGARVACRTVPPETGRDVRDRRGRRTTRAAASMSLLWRPHDHHRDLRKGLPAETPPRARCSDQDRHLIMPSPPIHQPSDARHSGWLGQHTRRFVNRAPKQCVSAREAAASGNTPQRAQAHAPHAQRDISLSRWPKDSLRPRLTVRGLSKRRGGRSPAIQPRSRATS